MNPEKRQWLLSYRVCKKDRVLITFNLSFYYVGIENSCKGSGLEYAYIDVRDDYRDDHTRLSVWVLDGDPAHTDLLKFALNEETFQVSAGVITNGILKAV